MRTAAVVAASHQSTTERSQEPQEPSLTQRRKQAVFERMNVCPVFASIVSLGSGSMPVQEERAADLPHSLSLRLRGARKLDRPSTPQHESAACWHAKKEEEAEAWAGVWATETVSLPPRMTTKTRTPRHRVCSKLIEANQLLSYALIKNPNVPLDLHATSPHRE